MNQIEIICRVDNEGKIVSGRKRLTDAIHQHLPRKIKEMTNIEKLKEIGILSDIRQVKGGSLYHEDNSIDELINKMTNHELVSCWSLWHLGSSDWWENMKSIFDNLNDMD